MPRWTKHLLFGILATVPAAPLWAQDGAAVQPTRIILFIGDGVGSSYWTAAAFAADKLAVQQFPVAALVDVRPTNNKVTDSAAGATAFAAGVKTYNGAVGVDDDRKPVENVLEIAAERGMGTGLIATSRITHATPAAFAAHVESRGEEWEIAKQIAESDITVVMGGGLAMFHEMFRPDEKDLLGAVKERYTYLEIPEDLTFLDPDTVTAIFGLFAESHMPPAIRQPNPGRPDRWIPDRAPTLPQMTQAALGVLGRNPEGFFLVVEASQPDWRGHGNEVLRAIVGEMLDFDDAIGVALEYQNDHPETLIVVVADHETGGLAVQLDEDGEELVAAFTTTQHTAQFIPLFARGPGAEEFGGWLSNDQVGRLLIQRVRRHIANGGD